MTRTRRPATGWIALALAVATVAAYLPLFGNDFVNYDDDLYILNNVHIQRGIDAETIAWAFTTFRGANWFPLTWLSWALDFTLFGRDPAGFHATSLAFHAGAVVLLFLAFVRLEVGVWRSAFVAGVFALHPLHVESVAWAAARKDVLSGFFAMLTLLAYVAYVRRGRRYYPLVCLCLALGLMAKPSLVTWPFVLLLLDFWPLGRLAHGRPLGPQLRSVVFEKIPLFLIAAAFSVITVVAQSQWGAVQNLRILAIPLRLQNAVTSYVAYAVDAFWPTGLAVFYPHPGHTLSSGEVLGSVLLLVLVTGLALQQWRRRPWIAVGWFWYLGVLLPMIGLVQVGQHARADRYTYLPLIGFSIPVIWAAAELAARGPRVRKAVAGAGVAALVALGIATHAQSLHWRDSRSLMRRALLVTERNHVAHINLGVVLAADGENLLAAHHLERALEIAPNSAVANGVLGFVRVETGRPGDAVPLFRRAIRREPETVRWREGLAQALIELGRGDEAIESYRRAVEIEPESARAWSNLGLAYKDLGRTQDAIDAFEEAIRIDPGVGDLHANLGVVLAESGADGRARLQLERALELDPSLALAHGHLGRVYARLGELEAAVAQARRGVELDPENGPLHAAFAQILGQAGRHAEAIRHYEQALALGERGVAAYVGLARARIAIGRGAQAVAPAAVAVELTERRIPAVLALLAEAQAAAGDFATAATTASEAAAVAEAAGAHPLAESYRARASTYRAGRLPEG